MRLRWIFAAIALAACTSCKELTVDEPIDPAPPPAAAPQYDEATLAGRQLLSLAEQRRSPEYSSCGRCWRPWPCVQSHTTLFAERQGCFPLCERCWSDLTPQERLPFYRQMFDRWLLLSEGSEGTQPDEWAAIEAAVLEGK